MSNYFSYLEKQQDEDNKRREILKEAEMQANKGSFKDFLIKAKDITDLPKEYEEEFLRNTNIHLKNVTDVTYKRLSDKSFSIVFKTFPGTFKLEKIVEQSGNCILLSHISHSGAQPTRLTNQNLFDELVQGFDL